MNDFSIWTIGHSTHGYDRFLSLLQERRISAIADVRSSPYSRHYPQFNGDKLKASLRSDGIAYSFLGKELGGRPRDSALFSQGVADYERMACTNEFREGLNRVVEGARNYRIALMCAERHPLDCHRCLLVGRALKNRGFAVSHILQDGSLETQGEIEEELLAEVKLNPNQKDFFSSSGDKLATAYRQRSRKVAYAAAEVG